MLVAVNMRLLKVDAFVVLTKKRGVPPKWLLPGRGSYYRQVWRLQRSRYSKKGQCGRRSALSSATWPSSPFRWCNSTLCRHHALSDLLQDMFGTRRLKCSVFSVSAVSAMPVLLLENETAAVGQRRSDLQNVWEKWLMSGKKRIDFLVKTCRLEPLLIQLSLLKVAGLQRLGVLACSAMFLTFVFVTRWR